jgi:hypothetical protein
VQSNSSTDVLNLIESRFDWITATGKAEGKGADLFAFGMDQLNADHRVGAKLREWHWQGYAGFHSGNWSCGWGREGAIVVASQEGSEIGYRTLAHLADHWSRCDVCVTGIDAGGEWSPVAEYWNSVKPGTPRKANAPECTMILNTKSGATFYIGQRSSAFYTRVYNKHVESDGEYPPGTWRFELEMKRHASESEQARIIAGGTARRSPSDLVATELLRQGFRAPWPNNAPIDRAKMPPRTKEVDRTITWLQDQVAPSVEFVVRQVGVRAAREALKL